MDHGPDACPYVGKGLDHGPDACPYVGKELDHGPELPRSSTFRN